MTLKRVHALELTVTRWEIDLVWLGTFERVRFCLEIEFCVIIYKIQTRPRMSFKIDLFFKHQFMCRHLVFFCGACKFGVYIFTTNVLHAHMFLLVVSIYINVWLRLHALLVDSFRSVWTPYLFGRCLKSSRITEWFSRDESWMVIYL